jgi:hypothetical protein
MGHHLDSTAVQPPPRAASAARVAPAADALAAAAEAYALAPAAAADRAAARACDILTICPGGTML